MEKQTVLVLLVERLTRSPYQCDRSHTDCVPTLFPPSVREKNRMPYVHAKARTLGAGERKEAMLAKMSPAVCRIDLTVVFLMLLRFHQTGLQMVKSPPRRFNTSPDSLRSLPWRLTASRRFFE